jgi:hypothetical protein
MQDPAFDFGKVVFITHILTNGESFHMMSRATFPELNASSLG